VTDDERSELIRSNLPLARRLARRYAWSPAAGDDLVQVASLGLVKAADRYDPGRGVSFQTFAIPTIVGEIKRHFRDTRWALRVPRDLQETAKRTQEEIWRLTAELGRAPTPREVSESLAVSVDEVLEARAAFSALDTTSLDVPLTGGDERDDDGWTTTGAEDPGYALVEERLSVAPLIAELPERERAALWLRYEEELTQREIGKQLGVSQMHVSRMLRRSIASIREAAAA
jgi:RNA polymerase sigma-B factor